ncbi:MAG: hypothetical protein ACFCUI_12240 [Bernardetiaceae bacterium]
MASNALLQYDQPLRTAYLSVLAGIATADHQNTPEEVAFIEQMAAAAELSDNGWKMVQTALSNPSNIRPQLEQLKDSDLKFSLLTDVLNLCYADGSMDEKEAAQVAQITDVLAISQAQFQTIMQYVQKANQVAEQQETNPAMLGLTGGGNIGDFLGQSGLLGMFQQNNIPTQNFQSGSTIGTMLTGMAASFLQNKLTGGAAQQTAASGGGLGGMLGAVMGGLSGGGNAQAGGLGGALGGLLNNPQAQQMLSGAVSQVMNTGQQKGQGLGNLASLLGGLANQSPQAQQKPATGGLGGMLGALLGG